MRTPNKISAEVQDIFSALGLELRNVPRRHFRKDFGPGYICKDIKTLRYRHVMIMTDQVCYIALYKCSPINIVFYNLSSSF